MRDPKRQCWQTPKYLFDVLNKEFQFHADLAASRDNCLVGEYIEDGLSYNCEFKRVFCNPPYGDIHPWVYKAYEANLGVLLVPARTDQEWFKDALSLGAEVHFFRGRIQFDPPEGVKKTSCPFASCLLVFDCLQILLKPTPSTLYYRFRDAKTGEYIDA